MGDVAAQARDLLVQGAVGVVVRAHEQVFWAARRARPATPGARCRGCPHAARRHTSWPRAPSPHRRAARRGRDTRTRPVGCSSSVTRAPERTSRAERRGWASIAPHTASTSALPFPGEMEARDRVAVAVHAALGPVDHGEEAHAVAPAASRRPRRGPGSRTPVPSAAATRPPRRTRRCAASRRGQARHCRAPPSAVARASRP